MLTSETLAAQMGTTVLYLFDHGAIRRYSVAHFEAVSRFAHTLGYTGLCFKLGEGTAPWYDFSTYQAIRSAIEAGGCRPSAFWYSIGGSYDSTFVRQECAVMRSYQDRSDGMLVVDMEVEWNGQTALARVFAEAMRGQEGCIITTWADPNEQAWNQIVEILAPVACAYDPQEYNQWLSTGEGEFGRRCLLPAIDLSREFGANDPVRCAQEARQRGHETLFVWEYTFARGNPRLANQVATTFLATTPLDHLDPVPPPPIPGPEPPQPHDAGHTYIVQPGDKLTAIAARELGDSNRWREIQHRNQATITAWAQEHGKPGNGNWIYPGEPLVLPTS